MRLSDLLPRERILVPLRAGSVAEGLDALLATRERDPAAPGTGGELLARLRSGDGGRTRRVSPAVLLLVLRGGEGDVPWAALGVAPRPLADEGSAAEPGPRVLLVLRAPGAAGSEEARIEDLARTLKASEVEAALLGASGPEDVETVGPLMEVELRDPLRVEDVLLPLAYRVFPDTPLLEVVALMARRGLRALPVVGKDLQVVGMITAGEALRYALERMGRGSEADDEESGATARDVMTRSVMCVSEDQDLLDAAQLMVNKGVAQLPVLREGEVVGLLTRDAVLRALFGGQ